jgi:hypothetical protein
LGIVSVRDVEREWVAWKMKLGAEMAAAALVGVDQQPLR